MRQCLTANSLNTLGGSGGGRRFTTYRPAARIACSSLTSVSQRSNPRRLRALRAIRDCHLPRHLADSLGLRDPASITKIRAHRLLAYRFESYMGTVLCAFLAVLSEVKWGSRYVGRENTR
jgi:hypothetical protein